MPYKIMKQGTGYHVMGPDGPMSKAPMPHEKAMAQMRALMAQEGKGMSRFSELSKKIQKTGKSKERADKISAAIGRKKYGKRRFAQMAVKGGRRKAGGIPAYAE